MIYIVIIVLGVVSFFLTRFLISFARKRHLFNYPNERSSHNEPTPRIGGVAIVLSWYIGLVVFFCLGKLDSDLFYALLCGSLIALVSLFDDIIEIKPIIRLLSHFVAVIGAFYFLGGIRPLISFDIGFLHNIVIYPLAVVGMVWFINLFNFLDGIDGYASVEAISIAIILFIFSSTNFVLLLLVSVVAGFLCWNWPKAKIFMGDTGSTQLGFILIVLGIYSHNALNFSILNWIMMASPFWFDATFTLYRRWKNHEQLSKAHKKHAYQRLVQAGYSHLQVDLWLIALNTVILGLIFLYRELFKELQIPIVVICLLSMYLITHRIDKLVPFK